MIERLSIRNLVLIEEAEIAFGPGFNILTGETGAGKSAVLSAIRLILGERADVSLIRKDAELAIVEASIVGPDALPMLIRRELHRSGRSRCFVEEAQVSLQELKQLFVPWIELVDQGASHRVSDAEEQRQYVDAFLGLTAERSRAKRLFEEWQETEARLRTSTHLQAEEGKDRVRLQEDLALLSEVDWKAGEEEQLSAEHHRLTNAQQIIEKLSHIAAFLSEGGEPILPPLKRFGHQLEQMQRSLPELQECVQSLHSASVSLDEVSRFLISYIDRLEADPHRLDAIEKRIAAIESIKRRFRIAQEEADALRKSLQERLARIDTFEEEMATLETAAQEAQKHFAAAAHALREQRIIGGRVFADAVLRELHTMNLPHAVFSVEVSLAAPSAHGSDRIQWYFAANPGQIPLPLDRSASGGELSRLLLAVKIAMAGKEGSSCVIFDEIDSNIGGKTAALLGEQLHTLSSSCQLISVTHFVQVARWAMHHFLVSKEIHGTKTFTRTCKLDEQNRQAEFDRMTGID